MNMIEKLTDRERDAIADYIDRNAGNCNGISCNLEHLLRFWNAEKQNLYKAFGENLILSKVITFTKPYDIIDNELEKAILCSGAPGRVFYDAFYNWRKEYCEDNIELYWDVLELMYNCNLRVNRWTSDRTLQIPMPDGTVMKVLNGAKISKVLGKLAKAFNLPGYEEFRIAHSMCLNSNKMTGELCLSIHPLDYMTMSDNECRWSSCMSWEEGGDYRQGTVEMMNSPCVVVAYLKSETDMKLNPNVSDSFTWSNKKWRKLFIVHPDAIVAIRDYPFSAPELSDYCLSWLRELAQTVEGFGPYDAEMTGIRNWGINNITTQQKDLYVAIESNFMYNDVHCTHNAYLAINNKSNLDIYYSGQAECMICGDEIDSNPDDFPASSLCCVNCGDFIRCDICGAIIYDPEYDAHYIGDSCICEHCYDHEVTYCKFCESDHFYEDLTKVYLKVDGEIKDYFIELCDCCLDRNPRVTECIGKIEQDEEGTYFIDINNLAEYWNSYFEIWNPELRRRINAIIDAKYNEDN